MWRRHSDLNDWDIPVVCRDTARCPGCIRSCSWCVLLGGMVGSSSPFSVLRTHFVLWFSRTLLASTHVNHNIYITEVKTGKCVHSLIGHRRTPWCVTFHPTISGLIASGCLDGEVRIWDLHVSISFPWSQRQAVYSDMTHSRGETGLVFRAAPHQG